MANTIQLKRSSVASKVPTTSDLELGELALNTSDGKLFTKKIDDGTASIVELSGGATGVIAQTQRTISEDYALTADHNGLSAGPVEVADGVTVTVPQTSDWQVINGQRQHGVIAEMLRAINSDYAISHHSHGLSYEDVAIGGSATITIPSTSTWRIL